MYKKNFFIILILISSLLLLIMLANYFIDAANQFYHSNHYEEIIANNLLHETSVAVQENCNDRLLQKIMLKRLKNKPDILILGSSHSLPISHDDLKNNSFYNASVSGAHLEDDIALFHLYEQRGWIPKTVIICVDPWIINKDYINVISGDDLPLWKTNLSDEYFAGKNKILQASFFNNLHALVDGFIGTLEKYLQLISLDLTKASVKYLFNPNYAKRHSITALDSCYIRCPDGALIPSRKHENITPQEADLAGINLIKRMAVLHRVINPIDAENASIFENFVTYLISQHINLIFYFPPLEPAAYTQMFDQKNNYHTVKMAEQYFISLGNKYHLKMIGSYDPVKQGLKSDDFIDSWHLKRKAIKKIFINLSETT